VLSHLWEVFDLKHPEIWVAKAWAVLHDRVPTYKSFLLIQQLKQHGTVVLLHSCMVSHHVIFFFYLFLWIKDQLKGCHFKDAVEVEIALKIAFQEVAHMMASRCVSDKCMNIDRSV
jgi:hypothetical protein